MLKIEKGGGLSYPVSNFAKTLDRVPKCYSVIDISFIVGSMVCYQKPRSQDKVEAATILKAHTGIMI